MKAKLPNRVFNSPLIKYVNFKNGTHINLIQLKKPYANGIAFAIHDTAEGNSGLFKTYDKAIERMYQLITRHNLKFPQPINIYNANPLIDNCSILKQSNETPVCEKCGSSNITGNTTARWSNINQKWICDPNTPSSDVYCEDCHHQSDFYNIINS